MDVESLEDDHLQLLASLPPERIIVSDMDIPMEEIRKEREAYQRRLRDQLTPQLVQLHPNVTVPMSVWMTPQEVVDISSTLAVESQQPLYKPVKCYHDSSHFEGMVSFVATGYDTVTDKFSVDVTFPFCSTECTRMSLDMEQQPKSAEKIYWTNELARRCGAIYLDRFAPPRAWLDKFCLLEDANRSLDIQAFRPPVDVMSKASPMPGILMEPVATRLCTMMEDPQHIILPVDALAVPDVKTTTTMEDQKSDSPSSSSVCHQEAAFAQEQKTYSPHLVVLPPYPPNARRYIWLTARQLIAASRRHPAYNNQFLSPTTKLPYLYPHKCCYHDGEEFADDLRFAAINYDTITDRFLVDVSVGYCSTACTRESLRTERQPKFMEKIHWTNEMAKRVFCEFDVPRFAPPRNCHSHYCRATGAGHDTLAFRNAVNLKHSTEMLHTRLEPISIRLCSMMPPPRLIQAIGDIGETRPYVTIISASNQQAPVSIEKPEHAQLMQQQMQQARFPALLAASTAATGKHSHLRSRGGGPSGGGMPGPVLAALNSIGLKNVSAQPYNNSSSSSSGSSHPLQHPLDSGSFVAEEILLPSGQIQVKPALTGLSRSYGVL